MEPRVVPADNAGPFALEGTRTHLVGREQVAVLDPGPADTAHLDRIRAALSGAREVMILLTHAHPDHWAGAIPLEATLRDGAVPGVERVMLAGAGPPPTRLLVDGARVETDEGGLLALHTPGHARPHLSFHWEAAGILFPGDLMLGIGNTAWVGSYPGCVADYLQSLDRVRELEPRRIFPAHGPPMDDPQEAIRRFREHRLHRIAQVEEAVQEDPDLSAEAIVHRVYGDELPSALREAAVWSVHAILDHLALRPFPPGAPQEEG